MYRKLIRLIIGSSLLAIVVIISFQSAVASSGVTLSEAVQLVKNETGGKILSANTIVRDGQALHRVKVLTTTGNVRVITYQGKPITKNSREKKPFLMRPKE